MAILAAFVFAAQTGCGFHLEPMVFQPQIAAQDDVASRVLVVSQPDSPVVITAADLTGFTLRVGSGGFDQDGPFSISVKNISDRILTRIQLGFRTLSGEGEVGTDLGRVGNLAPGATVTIRGGGGHGTGSASGEVRLALYVDAVEMSECRYKPSQAWPSFR